jgi:hypothetical protein
MSYSASVEAFHDPTTLTLVFGKPTLEDIFSEIQRKVGDIVTFSADTSDQIQVVAKEDDVQMAMLPEATISLDSLTWEHSLEFKVGDLLVIKTSDEIWKVQMTMTADAPVTKLAAVATPEPSTLILLGLGLISLIGIVRWKSRT